MNEILILTRKWVEHRCLFTNIHVESIKINWRNFTIRKTVSSFIQVEKHNRPITFTLLKLIKNIQLIPACIYTSSIYRELILMRIFFNLFYHKRRNFQNCIISLCIYSTLIFIIPYSLGALFYRRNHILEISSFCERYLDREEVNILNVKVRVSSQVFDPALS